MPICVFKVRLASKAGKSVKAITHCIHWGRSSVCWDEAGVGCADATRHDPPGSGTCYCGRAWAWPHWPESSLWCKSLKHHMFFVNWLELTHVTQPSIPLVELLFRPIWTIPVNSFSKLQVFFYLIKKEAIDLK